ncbi:MAG TPA: AI-2E family transporter, partial [Methanosarcina sp.]|nr:AI-2E family transporter [Methanosarcina sp.]
MERQIRLALALLLIVILSIVIIYAVLPYIDYLFGGFILFVIFKPLYHFFKGKLRFSRRVSAILVIIVSIFVVLIPLYFLLTMVLSEIQQIILDQEAIMESIHTGSELLSSFLSRLDINDSFQTGLEDRLMDLA